jgi:pyruvate/2-oxoacid:ferredoxin oxidoreductase alpha subunit
MSSKDTVKETITLMDDTEITVRPLKISLLRPFLKKFEGVAAVADDNEKSIDVLMECVAIAMQQYGPELLKDGVLLEDLVDLPTVYRIVDVASGIKLDEVTDLLNATMK